MVGMSTPRFPQFFKNLVLLVLHTKLITNPRIFVAMEPEGSASRASGFLKKVNEAKFGFLFYLIPVVLISVLLYMVASCFFVILVPLSAVLIPYYLGFRGPKRFAFFGVFVLLVNSMAFGAISTHRAYDYANYWGSFEPWDPYIDPQNSTDGVLSQGVFSPKSGGADTEFTFSVLYTDPNNMPPLYVHAVISDDLLAGEGNEIALNMTPVDPSDTDFTDGVLYEASTTLPTEFAVAFPEFPNHFHYYESDSTSLGYYTTAFTNEDVVSYGLGPMNAGFGEVYWLNLIWAFYNMLFVIALFYLGVAMYWWLSKARSRASQWQERMETMKKEEYVEFECDRCGADVPEHVEKCPKCGAVFDEDEEEELEPELFECDNCGADVPWDADKCPKCGEAFDEDED
jgi:ribosomal protein L40E